MIGDQQPLCPRCLARMLREEQRQPSPYSTSAEDLRLQLRALRAEVADLAAQLAADQLELARLRALEGL